VYDYPHTVSEVIRWREMINSFYELPKDKRPPEAIWFEPEELEEWFDRAFDRNKDTEFNLIIDDVEG
jgi:hypothetical protein